MTAVIDDSLCIGCGACVDACPTDSIEMPDAIAIVDESVCTDIGACIEVCPVDAISIKQTG